MDAGTTNTLANIRVGIVGLGLMGGSLAMALRGRVGYLLGIERDVVTRQTALRQGVVDEAQEELTAGAPSLDLLVLATPVRHILDTIGRLPALRPTGCTVLDLGSTKRAVVAAMGGLPECFHAVAGHPMCGKETAGFASAAPDLYRNQTFVLCPTPRTTPAAEALALALINAIEARPVRLDAADHDRIVAAVSHLPYIVAAALMRTVADEQLWAISAAGFRDTSRLAGTHPRMMLDILLTNREAILDALGEYEAQLAGLRRALARGDEGALVEWLAAAQVNYAAYRRFRSAEHLPTAPGLPSSLPLL